MQNVENNVHIIELWETCGDWYGVTKDEIKFDSLYVALLKYFEICNEFIDGTSTLETDGLHEYILENIGSELLDNEPFADFYARDLIFLGNLSVLLYVPSESWLVLEFKLAYCPDTKKYLVDAGLDPPYRDFDDFDDFWGYYKKSLTPLTEKEIASLRHFWRF